VIARADQAGAEPSTTAQVAITVARMSRSVGNMALTAWMTRKSGFRRQAPSIVRITHNRVGREGESPRNQ